MSSPIINMFDAAMEGTFEQFMKLFNGNVNEVNTFSHLNLLCNTTLNQHNISDKIKIMDFLFSQGIDINFADKKFIRTPFHYLFFCFDRGSTHDLLESAKKLYENGLGINSLDKFGAIPLKYAITISKMTTEEMADVYIYMLCMGSDYTLKDNFGKSCLDYAREYSWRNGFINIVEEFENGK